MNDDELYHYGVKGMKWGVRRDIKKKSRRAAYTSDYLRRKSYKIEKTKQKISDKSEKGKSTDKEESRLKKLQEAEKLTTKYYNSLTKDLSKKDILQGKRYFEGKKTIAITYFGIAGKGLIDVTTNAVISNASKKQ